MSDLLTGKKSLLDSIENKLKIKIVYLLETNDYILKILKNNNIKFKIVNKNFFNSFNKNLNHQFIAYELEKNFKLINLKQALEYIEKYNVSNVLILDSIHDAYNFGAIIRSAAAFGISIIFIKDKNQCPVNDIVFKISQGGINYIKICETNNLTNLINILKNNGFWVYGSILDEKATDINKIKFDSKSAIVLGNENKGISPLVSKNCDVKFYIKMTNNVQSLNVSVAAGIILNHLFKK